MSHISDTPPLPADERAEIIFPEALTLPPGKRADFLDQACGADARLRAEVESLLDDYDKAGNFLIAEASAALELGAEFGRLPPEQPGGWIGPYRLMEQIGEGGFGTVWVAEQEKPVRRRVALKIIKPGMDSREVIARFEQERQALALMDHPNIAKVFEAGATPLGRPYFVMELVRGVKITQYCDEARLSMNERLHLFIQVCHAVQHAHQKGIIHRDLKPSNILVTLHDGTPVPKVIDFGVAKATQQQRLTELTIYTQFEQMVGTPLYMSPEQAEMSGLDIDTRSDIYSLGVLLYELLTGTTPFDAKALLTAGFDEMRRIIRETEPQRPSTRLTLNARTTAKPPVARRFGSLSSVCSPVSLRSAEAVFQQPAAGSILKNGGPAAPGMDVDPPQERRATGLITQLSSLPSDLDWIVMKCLEKDRGRRYETAIGLAQDIQRHLSSEPVVARPASAAYRFRKMVRRNKVAFAATAAVLAALVTGLGISVWMYVRERDARERAVIAEKAQGRERRIAETESAKSRGVAGFLQKMLAGVGPSVARGSDTKLLRELLDEVAGHLHAELKHQPEVEAELRFIMGTVYHDLGEYGNAGVMLEEALAIARRLHGEDHAQVVAVLNELATTKTSQGRIHEAEELFRRALAVQQRMGWENVSHTLNNYSGLLLETGRSNEAEAGYRQALALSRKFEGNDSDGVAKALGNLGAVLDEQRRPGEAEPLLREALALSRKREGGDGPHVATILNTLANATQGQNKVRESEQLFRELAALQRKLLGDRHPNLATALNGLGLALHKQGRDEEAEPLLREGVEIEKNARSAPHPQTANIVGNLGRILEGRQNLADAETCYREALSIFSRLTGDEHPDVVNWRNRLAINLTAQKKWPELESLYREILAAERKRFGENHPDAAHTLGLLASVLEDQKKPEEAEKAYREALEAQRKSPGNGHPELQATLHNFALFLHAVNRSGEAEALMREAVTLARRDTGGDEADLADSVGALGRILERQQKYGEAEAMFREAVELTPKQPGSATNSWQSRLDRVLMKQGRLKEQATSQKPDDTGTKAQKP